MPRCGSPSIEFKTYDYGYCIQLNVDPSFTFHGYIRSNNSYIMCLNSFKMHQIEFLLPGKMQITTSEIGQNRKI